MSYQYKGKSPAEEIEDRARARFEYFRKAESAIDVGPAEGSTS